MAKIGFDSILLKVVRVVKLVKINTKSVYQMHYICGFLMPNLLVQVGGWVENL